MDDSSLPPNVIRLFPRISSTNSSTKQEHKQRGPERRRYSRRRPEQNQQGPGEKTAYLIDAITDVAIGNSRVKNKQNTRMQLPVLFLRKLHYLVVLSDIHEAHRRRDLRCCWRYPYRAGQHDQEKSDNLYVAG